MIQPGFPQILESRSCCRRPKCPRVIGSFGSVVSFFQSHQELAALALVPNDSHRRHSSSRGPSSSVTMALTRRKSSVPTESLRHRGGLRKQYGYNHLTRWRPLNRGHGPLGDPLLFALVMREMATFMRDLVSHVYIEIPVDSQPQQCTMYFGKRRFHQPYLK